MRPAVPACVQLAALQQLLTAPRVLLLDHNPLSSAGVRCIMAAVADCSAGVSAGSEELAGPQQVPLLVSVDGCRLLAPEKGLRAGLGSADVPALVTNAPTLLDLVVAPPPAEGKGKKAAKGKAKGEAKGKAAANGKGKKAAAKGKKAAAAAVPATAQLVVTEAAQGLDYSRPAGRYCLDLSHPASRQMLRDLLLLQNHVATAAAAAAAAAESAAPAAGAAARAAAAKAAPAAIVFTDILVNGKAAKQPKLEEAVHLDKGSVSFGVKAPALLPAGCVPLPAGLLAWALQQLCQRRASEMWKVQLIELLAGRYLVAAHQAVQVGGALRTVAVETVHSMCLVCVGVVVAAAVDSCMRTHVRGGGWRRTGLCRWVVG